ncbi:MAG: CARDB domain-containing protein [Thermoplasmata archaeon]
MSSKLVCLALISFLLISPTLSFLELNEIDEIHTIPSNVFRDDNITRSVNISSPLAQTARPSEVVTYRFRITNNGTEDDSYNWSVESEHGWVTSDLQGTSPPLTANGSYNVNVTIGVPDDLENNTVDHLVLQVVSTTNESVAAEGHTQTYAEVRNVEVRAPSSKEGKVFESLTYRFEVINSGWLEDSYSWSAHSGHGWITSQSSGSIYDLGTNESYLVSITVTIPGMVDAHTVDELTLTVTSITNTSVSDSDMTYTFISESHSIRIDPPASVGKPPNSEFTLTYNVTNTGNVKGTSYKLSSYVDNDLWETYVVSENPTPPLDPGENISVEVFVSIPDVTTDYDLDGKDIYYGAAKDIVLRVEAPNGYINSSVSTVTVTPYYSTDIRAQEPYQSIDHRTTTTRVEFVIEVMNLCNIRDEDTAAQLVTLSEEEFSFISPVDDIDEEKRWTLSISNPEVSLKGGEMKEVLVVVTAPREPLNGTCYITLQGSPEPLIDLPGTVNNDTCEIGVTVNQSGSVQVESRDDEMYGKPLEWVYFNHTLINTGNGIDRFSLVSSTENDWDSEIFGNTVTRDLMPGEETNVTIRVKVPERVAVGFREKVRLTAYSMFEKDFYSRDVSDFAESTLIVSRGYAVMLKPNFNETSVYPGESAVYELIIINTGNTQDIITLSLDHDFPQSWEAELLEDSFFLNRWNSTTTHLTVTPDHGAIHEVPFNVTITARSSGNPDKTDDAIALTHVIHVPDLEIELNRTILAIKPGEILNSTLSVTNTGNGNDTFYVQGNISNQHWDVLVEGDPVSLTPGETGSINVSIEAPQMPGEGDLHRLEILNLSKGMVLELKLNATSQADTAVKETISKDVTVEQVRIHEINALGDEKDIFPGRYVEHEIQVKNLGNSRDNVTLTLENNTSPYADHSYLDREVVELNIGELTVVDLTVNVPVSERPYWHEVIEISVSNMDLTAEASTFSRVVMLDLDEKISQIKIGRSLSLNVTMINLPNRTLHEDGVGPGDTLMNTFDLAGSFATETDEDDWDISFETDEIDFTRAYENETVMIVFDSPMIEYRRPQMYRIEAVSTHTELMDEVMASIELFWFDIIAEEMSIEAVDGGRALDVVIRIRISGMELISEVPFEIWIHGQRVHEEDLEYVDRIIGIDEETRVYRTRYEIGEWEWSKISRTVEVSLIVDPESEFYEINAADTAEGNNELSEEKMTSKFMDIPWWVPVLILILSVFCFIFSWVGSKDWNYFLLPMGVSLGGISASLILMPWHSIYDSSVLINDLSLGVIVSALIVFAAALFVLAFYSKGFINLATKYLIQKNGWENYFKEDLSEDETYHPHLFYLITGLTGLSMSLTFLLLTSLNYLVKGEISSVFKNDLYNVPVLLFIALYFVLGVIFSTFIVWIYEDLTQRIVKNEKVIEDLSERAQRESGGETDV